MDTGVFKNVTGICNGLAAHRLGSRREEGKIFGQHLIRGDDERICPLGCEGQCSLISAERCRKNPGQSSKTYRRKERSFLFLGPAVDVMVVLARASFGMAAMISDGILRMFSTITSAICRRGRLADCSRSADASAPASSLSQPSRVRPAAAFAFIGKLDHRHKKIPRLHRSNADLTRGLVTRCAALCRPLVFYAARQGRMHRTRHFDKTPGDRKWALESDDLKLARLVGLTFRASKPRFR